MALAARHRLIAISRFFGTPNSTAPFSIAVASSDDLYREYVSADAARAAAAPKIASLFMRPNLFSGRRYMMRPVPL